MPKQKSQTGATPIGTIETNIGDQYLVGKKIGEGGSGVVYRATSTKDEKVVVAVKFYLIPDQAFLFGTTAQAFWHSDEADEKVYETERKTLKDLQHPGIQEVLGWGTVCDAAPKFSRESAFRVPATGKVRFLVSHHISGESIDKWVAGLRESAKKANQPERHRIRRAVIQCIIDLLEALDYLHSERHHQHSDIRAENILIQEQSERPILIDFGYSQTFDDALMEASPVTRVRPLELLNIPLELRESIQKIVDVNGKTDRPKLKQLLFPGLDVYHFGRLLQDLLDKHGIGEVITPLDESFLRLIALDLTKWDIARVTPVSRVFSQLQKLVDGYWAGASAPQAPQLSPGQPVRMIALPDGGFVASQLIERILETFGFRRLQQLKQLSLLQYVYPGATQSRFEHCLGVYSLAVRLVNNLARSPRFTKLFDTAAVGELLITALLHDINHFPFLHYCQELKVAKENDVNLFELFVSGEMTNDDPSIKRILEDAGVDCGRILEVLNQKASALTDPRQQVIKSVIDGGIDIDKLAYVRGDARATGVPFGLGVDISTLLSCADIIRQPEGDSEGGSWHLCFEPRALSAVESLLLARYWNFKQIYWHHTNRALGAMVLHVLRAIIGGRHLSLQDYILATMGRTEFDSLVYLDKVHADKLGGPSLLRGLVERRAGVFKRLLSIRCPVSGTTPLSPEDIRRRNIFNALKEMSEAERNAVVSRFASSIKAIFPKFNRESVILLDLPGRALDADMGQVFVTQPELDGKPTAFIQSPFIQILQTEFSNLARTARLFIAPEVRDALGREKIAHAVPELEKLLEASLRTPGSKGLSPVG